MSQGPSPIEFDQRPAVPSHVLTREINGEMVLLSLGTESYFGLDSVGTAIWRRVVNSESLNRAFDQLLEEYDVDPVRLRRDMEELIHQLVEKGLLVLDVQPGAPAT